MAVSPGPGGQASSAAAPLSAACGAASEADSGSMPVTFVTSCCHNATIVGRWPGPSTGGGRGGLAAAAAAAAVASRLHRRLGGRLLQALLDVGGQGLLSSSERCQKGPGGIGPLVELYAHHAPEAQLRGFGVVVRDPCLEGEELVVAVVQVGRVRKDRQGALQLPPASPSASPP